MPHKNSNKATGATGALAGGPKRVPVEDKVKTRSQAADARAAGSTDVSIDSSFDADSEALALLQVRQMRADEHTQQLTAELKDVKLEMEAAKVTARLSAKAKNDES